MARHDDILRLLKQRSYTVDEIAKIFGLEHKMVTMAMHRVRQKAEVQTELSVGRGGRIVTYTFIKDKPPKEKAQKLPQKPKKDREKPYARYSGYQLNELPKKIDREDLIDWYNAEYQVQTMSSIQLC